MYKKKKKDILHWAYLTEETNLKYIQEELQALNFCLSLISRDSQGKKDTYHTQKQIFQCRIPTLLTPP